MTTTDAKITMTTTEHAWVWDSLKATVDNYATASDEMSERFDLNPRNAFFAIERVGSFVKTAWEAENAERIIRGTEGVMKSKNLPAEAALEAALEWAVEQVKDALLNNRFAASSTCPATNMVGHYKAEAATQWLQGIGSYTRVLASAKKAE
ncbi:MAG: hypothetical protein GY838_12845 [bacterium]|nr:hypothetical protein [bacterium]